MHLPGRGQHVGLQFDGIGACLRRLHTLVGKTARRLAFASRWMPGGLRKRMRLGRG